MRLKVLFILFSLSFSFLLYLSPFSFPSYAHLATTATPAHHPLTPAADCGLPRQQQDWTTATTQTVWNLTADCLVPAWPPAHPYIRVRSGEFTINGNGYSIIAVGNHNNWLVATHTTSGSAPVLHLNNINIVGGGGTIAAPPVRVRGGTMHLTNVVIRNHNIIGANGFSAVWVDSQASAYLKNVQIINNNAAPRTANIEGREPGSALTIWDVNEVVLDGVIFRSNRRNDHAVRVQRATLTLKNCVLFENNYKADGGRAADFSFWGNRGLDRALGNVDYILNDSERDNGRCPKKKVKPTLTPWPSATPRPPESYRQEYIQLQAETGIDISATHGLASGVHFRQLDGAGIGVQALIDAGPLEAIDVYGYVEQGVEICFPHIGRVIFLDAAASPRTMTALEAWQDNGATCVSIDSAGSLVLLPPE